MKTEAENVKDYLGKVPEERREAIKKLYKTISQNLPEGFAEGISNGMMGWVVPLDIYPAGYHCTPGNHCRFWGWHRRKILSTCITWEFMQSPNFTTGLWQNFRNIPKRNWIWENPVSASKNLKTFRMN